VAEDAASSERVSPVFDGAGLRVAVLCGRFNDEITFRLLDGARRGLSAAGVGAGDVEVTWVPGAFELPFAAQTYAQSGLFDAIVVLGAVIRGETTHYELVSGECARGVQDVQLKTGVPVLFGVLTTETLAQALARSEGPGGHNVGEECGLGAVEVVGITRALRAKMG